MKTFARVLRVLFPTLLIVGWFALFGLGGASFGKISDVSTNEQSQFLPATAEATEVGEIVPDFLGSDTIPAIVVFTGDGELSESEIAEIEAWDFSGLEGVQTVSPPIISDDGEAAQVIVPIDSDGEIRDIVTELRTELEGSTLTASVTGPAGFTADLAQAFSGIDGLLLGVALAAVFVILVIVYRSPLLPLIVLFTSLSALCASIFTIVLLAQAEIIILSGQTQGILFILVIGAATDYALLYIARYREALIEHERRWAATWAALKGAWEPILASGGTVIAALLILLFSELNSNKSLGPVASIGIAFAVLAAMTLLPALLLAAGRVAFWPRRPRYDPAPVDAAAVATGVESLEHPAHRAADGLAHTKATAGRGLWARIARLVSTRPRIVWIVSVVILGVLSLGLLNLKADGVPTSEFVLGASEARDGQAALGEHFPAGSGTPAYIVGPEADLQAIADIALDMDGVSSVAVVAEDSPSGFAPVTADGIQPLGPPGTPAADPTVVDGRVLLQATLDAASDSDAAEDAVAELRLALDSVGEDVLVGGQSAVALDTKVASIADRNLIIPLVLVAILLILMLLLRSIIAPLILIGSVVLSFGAALGVSAWVFNGIFDFPGADPSVPLFGFVFLVALGVDYNIFLMTRVREESILLGTRAGILRGLTVTGGVITSAGLVLAATFAALGVIPILFLAQISFIVAFGVLLDTFLVRTLLVPALAYDLGRRIWWPSPLARGAK
ncbi:MMPL family transporter [Agromyces atrinae]|uniref:MMPL family transporter n=1 Tax=Agromyces atrinae TaxID=592376 RepID=A0A4Q2MBA2_9MICO|nr:MMPL family transporter [Agromyces atrinae]NYD66624.1 RND superfamily putative drug exporter [Agromyces atrinae]RXZ87292.1 MMPL family transporter [Agromyces atrinae]